MNIAPVSPALISAYDSLKSRCGEMPLDSFCACFADWQAIQLEANGEVVGAVLIRAQEMHIALQPSAQGHVWLRRIIRQHVGDVIRAHGMATTKVMNDHAIGHRLAKLIGFKQVASCDKMTEYECTEVAL